MVPLLHGWLAATRPLLGNTYVPDSFSTCWAARQHPGAGLRAHTVPVLALLDLHRMRTCQPYQATAPVDFQGTTFALGFHQWCETMSSLGVQSDAQIPVRYLPCYTQTACQACASLELCTTGQQRAVHAFAHSLFDPVLY
jgi:hypothetical protein